MNSWDLGNTVSTILQCIHTCHGILGIPDPEMCTCGIMRTLGCGTLGTLVPESYTCHGTLGTQDPEMHLYLTWDPRNPGS